MPNFNEGWYLIYTRSRFEKKVVEILSGKGMNCFLPIIRTLRNWSGGRRKYIDMPMFPSYVFVYLKCLTGYFDILDMEGVLYFVRVENKIVRVRESVIESIRILAEMGTELEVSTDVFLPGQCLDIHEGPLTGLECEVVQVSGKTKVLVRVKLLQRSLLATLPVQSVGLTDRRLQVENKARLSMGNQ